jgi:coenzyme F420-dependent glucose-6-phosphate dehydrogenase
MALIRLGFHLPSGSVSLAESVDLAVRAEHAGFDMVIAVGCDAGPGCGPGALASTPLLAAIGARTERVTLGNCAFGPALDQHPAVLAQAFATLGCLFPGRVSLGIGAGQPDPVTGRASSTADGRERFAMLKEALSLIRLLWTEDRVSFRGEHFRTDRATVYDRPEAPVPIHLAATGSAVVRLAGRMADGIVVGADRLAAWRSRMLPVLTEGCSRSGRTPAQGGEVLHIGLRGTAGSGADPDPGVGLAGSSGAGTTRRTAVLSGDPGKDLAVLHTYRIMGFSELIVDGGGSDGALELTRYASRLLPRIRRELPLVS